MEQISVVVKGDLPGQQAKLEALLSEGFEEAVARNGHQDDVGRRIEEFEQRVNEQIEYWKQHTSQTVLASQQTSQSLLTSLSSRFKVLEEEQPRLEVGLGELGGGLKGTRDKAAEQAKRLALLEERDEKIQARVAELGLELEQISAVVKATFLASRQNGRLS